MRLRFLRATGLGNQVAQPGDIVQMDELRGREFLLTGRAVPAPEVEPEAAQAPLPSPPPQPTRTRKGKP